MYDLYDLFPLHDLDLSPFKADLFKILSYDTAHAAGWDRYNLHDLAYLFPDLDLYYADPAQPITTAGAR